MPQNTVLPDWRATYPIEAPAMKPPGVTVLTTATAPRVPNKPTYTSGTIQLAAVESQAGPQLPAEEHPVAKEEEPHAKASKKHR